MFTDTFCTNDLVVFDPSEDDMYLADNSFCTNAVCSCPVVEPGTFCSDHCRGISGDDDVTCDCEHSSCVSAVVNIEAATASALVN